MMMRKFIIPIFILVLSAVGFAANADEQLKLTTFGQWTLQSVKNYDPKTSGYPEHLIFTGTNWGAKDQVQVSVYYDPLRQSWAISFRFTPDHDVGVPLRLKFSSGFEGPITVENCTPNFCKAIDAETGHFLRFFRLDTSAALVVTNKEGLKSEIPFSLDGFTKAFEELKKVQK